MRIDLPECLEDRRVVIVDVETTGFSPTKNRVIELGLIWIEDNEIVMELSQLCNPGCEIPAEITELTNITQEMVDGAEPFEAICPFVLDTLSDSIVVAFNARFDFGFLKEEVSRCGRTLAIESHIDPLLWVRQEDKGQKCSLSVVAERRGISMENAHRALDDCKVTLEVMNTINFPRSLRQVLQTQSSFSSKRGRRRGMRY